MKRIKLSEALKNTPVNIQREYERLYDLFYNQKLYDGHGSILTLRIYCAANFRHLPFRKTCTSLNDFDECYGYIFKRGPADFDINYLINFCEYSYNLVNHNQDLKHAFDGVSSTIYPHVKFYIDQVLKVIESIGYMEISNDNITTDFVPKDPAAISVAEIVDDPTLSYKVIEYNHHTMKGDLEQKKEILLSLGNKLEPQREKLKKINSSLADDIFFLFNNANIRHNNTTPEGNNYKPIIAKMSKKKIEQWYDDTYQMCLLAFLELEHIDRKRRIDQLKKDIQSKA